MSHESSERVLLPTNVKPLSYAIHIKPNLKDFVFDGEETVDIEVKQETSTIVIHSHELKIKSASVRTADNSEVVANNFQLDEKLETVTISFPSSLKVGKAKLSISFSGDLGDTMMGFYRSKYQVNGETRHMATTQFEPTGARKAFPCWDEPAVKSVFNISLTFDAHLTGLSNMDPVSEKTENGLKTVQFAESPIMSTYLVAFVIGEFDYVEDRTKEGVRVRIYTPPGKKSTGEFSLRVACKVLSYFGEYYGIPYPLPKCDMVAIADFAAGAMENWGLITYRETALLIDEKFSGIASKSRVAYVVAHELAHQWFGNLVTMEWWKELWLNEGFATFVGNQAIDHLFPSWDVWTQFITDYYNTAQALDSLENSHPIEVEVQSSAQIEEIFDAISYHKGASIIRMICNRIGEANFRKGLNIYLNRFKYSNAVTEDLWQALSEASGSDVRSFMNNYTKITGYPLVSVSSAGGNQFSVKQNRFFSSGKELTAEEAAQTWWISIPVVTSKDPKSVRNYDFKEKQATLTFEDTENAEWIKVNAGQSGFFRTSYSDELAGKLTKAIQTLQLSSVDRIGIQNDAFALSVSGLAPLTTALNLAKAYSNEVEYTVWNDLATNLAKVGNAWSEEPVYPQYRRFVVDVFKKIGTQLGWDPKPDESDLNKLLRVVALASLGNNGDQEVIQEAKRRFAAHIKNETLVPPDLRGFVFKMAVMHGGIEEYEQVLNLYRTAEMHEERIKALRALGATTNVELITRTLNFVLTPEVRAQDIFIGFHPITQSPVGRNMVWDFLRTRWDDIYNLLKSSFMLLDRTIGYSTNSFVSEEKAKEIEEFFTAHPIAGAERTIKQSIEYVRSSARWLANNREGVAAWLNQNYPASS